MVDFSMLQNGSDIRGVALKEGGQAVTLTDDATSRIAKAFASFVSKKEKKPLRMLSIGIGRDSRLSAEHLVAVFTQALTSLGVDVYDCGLCSTPAMFMSTITEHYAYDGAVMVTASHLPFDRNGFKFFTQQGGTNSQEITEILKEAQKNDFLQETEKGKVSKVDFISVYSLQLVEQIRKEANATDFKTPLSPFHIIVDAGGGAGGFFVEHVLKPLGANTEGSQFLTPDGYFSNHVPNPEDKQAMQSITEAVLQNKADLGIIFDTDVDRAAIVDSSGKSISRNRFIALLSAIVLEENPNTTIVTDSVTSSGLAEFIEALGGKHHRFRRGYKNVIDEAIRLNKIGEPCALAMETSGHGALKENYFLDDGAYLVTKVLIQMAKMHKENREISSLIAQLKEPEESYEFRLEIEADDFEEYGIETLAKLYQYALEEGIELASPNYEGIRLKFKKEKGWLLLRLSLHDPLMPLNVESDIKGGCAQILKRIYPALASYKKLNSKAIAAWIE